MSWLEGSAVVEELNQLQNVELGAVKGQGWLAQILRAYTYNSQPEPDPEALGIARFLLLLGLSLSKLQAHLILKDKNLRKFSVRRLAKDIAKKFNTLVDLVTISICTHRYDYQQLWFVSLAFVMEVMKHSFHYSFSKSFFVLSDLCYLS